MNSRATPQFWRLFHELPEEVQEKARAAYRIWRENPRHAGLHFKRLHGSSPPVWPVRIGLGWRALAVQRDKDFVWFWIGSHAGYDRLAE